MTYEIANPTLQTRIYDWLIRCFGRSVAVDRRERAMRVLEEAVELVQAGGLSEEDTQEVVAYVYSRPVGEIAQEFGGVSITLYAMASAYGYDLEDLCSQELRRCEGHIDKIRNKHSTKPPAIRGAAKVYVEA